MSLSSSWYILVFAAVLAGCAGGPPQGDAAWATKPPATLTLAVTNTSFNTPVPPTSTQPPSATSPATTAALASATPSLTATPARATRLPDPTGFTWQVIARDFNQPLGLVSAPDGSGRLFIVEKGGLIRLLKDGQVPLEPFLDLRDRVSVKGATTRGLLGLVFHPQFAENGYFYVHYTGVRGDLVIARYRATADLSSGDPATESILLQVTPPVGEHNGGDLAFGPDGYLYISLGDGGGPGNFDQAGNAQNPETLLGSLLRLDVNGGEPYQIPPDNPYVAGGGRPEIWAYGLRNPWRFTFDPSTGDLYLADVGESSWEEIDFLPAGGSGGVNFGWNYREGAHRFRGEPGASLALVDPVAEYDHTQGCSVTGGRLYRGTMLPEWAGVYLFGDYCQGKIWGLLRKPDGSWQMDLLFQIQAFITSFGVDEQGEVYLVTITGQILKLVRK